MVTTTIQGVPVSEFVDAAIGGTKCARETLDAIEQGSALPDSLNDALATVSSTWGPIGTKAFCREVQKAYERQVA